METVPSRVWCGVGPVRVEGWGPSRQARAVVPMPPELIMEPSVLRAGGPGECARQEVARRPRPRPFCLVARVSGTPEGLDLGLIPLLCHSPLVIMVRENVDPARPGRVGLTGQSS